MILLKSRVLLASATTLGTNSLINVVLELASLAILFIILYSSTVQNRKEHTQMMFNFWTVNLIILLFCELFLEVVSFFLMENPDSIVLTVIHHVLFVMDFFLYNMLAVTYYVYMKTFIKTTPKSEKELLNGLKLAKINVFVLTAIFASSLFTGWFYSFGADLYEYYTPLYLPLELVVIMNWHLLLIPVKFIRKQCSKKKRLILSLYIWAPLILLPIDYIFNLTLSYTAYTLATLLIYVEVDIQKARERAQLEAQVAQTENKMKDMQVELMMSQIHPHFLYNTLSSISCLCREDPKEAEAATNEFSDYLKANLSSINARKPIPFEKELLHAESYLKIQKRRFPDTLHVIYDVCVIDFMMPALTLQPIVENAIKHAVESRYEPTTIRISTYATATDYVITVEDDGPGFDVNAPVSQDRPHLEINSARTRLQEMSDGTLTIDSTPGKGTVVTITIPKETENK